MYEVGHGSEVDEQIEALPVNALEFFAEARVLLEANPWSGEPYHEDRPDGSMRSLAFGGLGFVVYLVLEDQRRVELLAVAWLG